MGQPLRKDNRKDESRDWGLILLIFSIFIFIGALFYEGQEGEHSALSVGEQNPLDGGREPHKILNNINTNLKEAALKEEILKQSIETESAAAPPTEHNDPEADGYDDKVLPLVLDQENPGQRVLSDTERRKNKKGRPLTPDQRISAKIEKETWVNEDEKLRQEEYVKQFLQNARKNGVNIRLNKNLDVTGINKVPVEEPIRIPQSSSGGSK